MFKKYLPKWFFIPIKGENKLNITPYEFVKVIAYAIIPTYFFDTFILIPAYGVNTPFYNYGVMGYYHFIFFCIFAFFMYLLSVMITFSDRWMVSNNG